MKAGAESDIQRFGKFFTFLLTAMPTNDIEALACHQN